MKAFRNLISITIYLFFTVGILSVTRVVIEEIKTLSVEKVKALGEALLDFLDLDDLLRWLRANRIA